MRDGLHCDAAKRDSVLARSYYRPLPVTLLHAHPVSPTLAHRGTLSRACDREGLACHSAVTGDFRVFTTRALRRVRVIRTDYAPTPFGAFPSLLPTLRRIRQLLELTPWCAAPIPQSEPRE